MTDNQSAPPSNLSGQSLREGASAVWSRIESVADFVADLFGVTVPMYEIYMDDALEYQKDLESKAMIPKTVQYEPQASDWKEDADS